MVVAKDQLKQLLEITLRHIESDALWDLLHAYKKTEAYKRNKSFRQTIDRMLEDLK